MEKRSSFQRFKTWFTIGALIFGTYCGGNMASGVYAAGYIVTKGGGWALVWLAMFCLAMSFFCTIMMNFIRCFQVDNYNTYYLSLYGINRPDANILLKSAVTIFFDCYTLCSYTIGVSATISLFTDLVNSTFGIPTIVARVFAVLLYAFLTMYGAAFLRRFNTVMTLSLLVSLFAILVAVINVRGDILMNRIGNFNEGLDWGGTTLAAHFAIFLPYCFQTTNWGATLCNHGENVHDSKDAVGVGITCGLLCTCLFAATAAIVLPFMPEAMEGTPILMICQQYLSPVLTAVYFCVVMCSIVSTGPAFTFNVANRFSRYWKNENVSKRTKFFTIGMIFLVFCCFVSNFGLMKIVQNGYKVLGSVGGIAIGIPLVISIPRVYCKDKSDKTTLKEQP